MNSKTAQCLSTHLDSPLLCDILLEAIKAYKGKINIRNNRINNIVDQLSFVNGIKGIPDIETLTPHIQCLIPLFNSFIQHIRTSNNDVRKLLQSWKSVSNVSELELKELTAERDINWTDINDLKNCDEFEELVKYHKIKQFLESGVVLSARPATVSIFTKNNEFSHWSKSSIEDQWNYGSFQTYYGKLNIWLSNLICVINIGKIWFLTTREHYLMIHDVISQRFNIHMAVCLANQTPQSNYPSHNDLKLFYNIGDKILLKYGNKGYKAISLWEGCVVSYILSFKEDKAVDVNSFKSEIRESFVTCFGNDPFLEELYALEIDPFLGTLNLNQLSQIFGLYRLFGHPTINTREGLAKLKSIAMSPRPINYKMIALMTWKFREMFYINYFKKHRRYPNFKIVDKMDNFVTRSLKMNLPFSLKSPQYRLSMWDSMEPEQTLNIPEKFELQDLIADKSLSLNKTQLKRECLNGNIGKSTSRSVILKWLETNYQTPMEFINDISLNGFSDDDLVIGLYPKEREEKNTGRFFALLTMKCRTYVVLTESMIADKILPYFPDITMTLDGTSLYKIIHQDTQVIGDQFERPSEGEWNVIVNMDFEKWNTHMRKDETLGIFSDMDKLFGISHVITRTHDLFTESDLYLADGSFVPYDKYGNPKYGNCMWRGHRGGLDGMRQKGWTVFTNVVLRYIMDELDLRCKIRGQGDNQVLIIKYRNKETLIDEHKRTLQELDQFLKQIGPPLKLSETWSSSHLFSYGKYHVFNGVPLSMSLKKICRMMPLTNEGHQNIESTLSSIAANASSASLLDYTPIIPFLMARFSSVEALLLHIRHPFYNYEPMEIDEFSYFRIPINGQSNKIRVGCHENLIDRINNLNHEVISSILILPSVLGGYPTVQLYDLISHGFPDPLTLAICFLRKLYLRLPDHLKLIKKSIENMLNPIINTFERNWKMLIEDPTSLNLIHCSSGSDKIKNMVIEFISKTVNIRNNNFKTFLAHSTESLDPLCDLLSTMNPLNPRICHSILDSTIIGFSLRVVGKISKSPTLQSLMMGYKSSSSNSDKDEFETELGLEEGTMRRFTRMENLFFQFENNYYKNVLKILFCERDIKYCRNPSDINCSRQYAQYLRVLSWGERISGVTVAVPAESFIWSRCNSDTCLSPFNKDSWGYVVAANAFINLPEEKKDMTTLTLGPFKPYFGSSTKNKVHYDGKMLKEAAPAVMIKAIDNLCLIGWGTNPDSNLSYLIKQILNTYSDIDPNSFIPTPGDISGSVEHRWTDTRTSHSSTLSIMYHLGSWIVVNTNNYHPEDAVGFDNVNLSYQTVLTYITSILSCSLMYDDETAELYHLHQGCKFCITGINEEMMEIDNPDEVVNDLERISQESLEYCWIPKESLDVRIRDNIRCLFPSLDPYPTYPHLRKIYNMMLCDMYLSKNNLSLSDDWYYRLQTDSDRSIPFAQCKYMEYEVFISDLVTISYLYYMYHIAYTDLNYDTIKSFQAFMINLHIQWYSGLGFMTTEKDKYSYLVARSPGSHGPLGNPPSLGSIARSLRSVIISYVNRLTKSLMLDNIENLFKKCTIKTMNIIFHPFIIYIISLNLSSSQESKNESSGLLISIRTCIKGQKREVNLNSNSDLNNIILKQTIRSNNNIIAEYRKFKRKMPRNYISVSGYFDGIRKHLTPVVVNKEDPINKLGKLIIKKDDNNGINILTINRINGKTKKNLTKFTFNTSVTPLFKNHTYKLYGLPSSSVYKFLSIWSKNLDLFNQINSSMRYVVCLGDGSGGFSLYSHLLFKPNRLYYNTFYEIEKVSEFTGKNTPPSALIECIPILDHTDGIDKIGTKNTDITSPEFETNIPLNYHTSLVCCDAEGSGWGNPRKGCEIAKTIARVSRKTTSLCAIVKTYLSRPDMVYAQILLLMQHFKCITIFRSHFSTINNTEVYLICSKPMAWVNMNIIYKSMTSCEIECNGDFETDINYTQFVKTIMECNYILKREPGNPSIYDYHLRQTNWAKGIQMQINSRLGLIQRTNKKLGIHIIFPTYLYDQWRKEINLVRFSRTNVSGSRLNFISLSLVRKLVGEYIELEMCIYQDLDESYYNSRYAIIYGTSDGYWSLALSSINVELSKGQRSFAISDILGKNDWKSIYRRSGVIKDLTSCITIKGVPLNQLGMPLFCTEVNEWWHTGVCLPPRYAPMYSRAYIPGSGVLEEGSLVLKRPRFGEFKGILTDDDILRIDYNMGLDIQGSSFSALRDMIQYSRKHKLINRIIRGVSTDADPDIEDPDDSDWEDE